MAQREALGLEFSTQSVKAILVDIDGGQVTGTAQMSFDEAFPEYKTEGGVLPAEDPAVRHTSPSMVLEALDRIFEQLRQEGADLGSLHALKVDAQQHCSVYADASLSERLQALETSHPLVEQIAPAFTRSSAPIWEDRSTAEEVAMLEEQLRDAGGLIALTGNRGERRFPAAQIVKWAREAPESYDATSHVLVLSAFLSSVLAGRVAPVDTGDGWGTNLNTLDIKTPGWNRRVIEAVDELVRSGGATTSVAEKLGEIDHYDAPVGRIHPYFAQKYGINEQATVLCGTGDNPATLLGTGGRLVISLGSSYTVNGPVDDPKPSPDAEYNIFGYTPGRAMALSVITNGAKLHDEFKRRYVSSGSWEEYRELAGSTAVAADEPLMLPYLQEESVPQAPAGIRRDGFDEADAAVNVRALHVSQALSLRLHSAHLSNVDSFAVVGGGSRNPVLRQMLTDAFGAPSYLIEKGDFAAPLGCAIAAARHVLDVPYEDAADRFVEVQQGSRMEPDTSLTPVYRELQERYRTLEQDQA